MSHQLYQRLCGQWNITTQCQRADNRGTIIEGTASFGANLATCEAAACRKGAFYITYEPEFWVNDCVDHLVPEKMRVEDTYPRKIYIFIDTKGTWRAM